MADAAATIAEMQLELAALRRRTEALEDELERLGGESPAGRSSASTVSRRTLLRQAGSVVAAGAAGAIGAGFLAAGPALAGPTNLQLDRTDNQATGPTEVIVNGAAGQFGIAVIDHAASPLPDSACVVGHANGSFQVGVLGFAEPDHAFAVEGRASGANGVGVLGRADHGIAIEGQTSDGFGVYGVGGSGIGVIGSADTGRGGSFSGKAAAIRLSPTKASTHPSSGLRGDLIVDKSGRLWFCKGGTNWIHVA